MTLRRRIWLTYGLMIGGAVLLLAGVSGGGARKAPVVAGLIAQVLSIVMDTVWHRCPHCGASLGRTICPDFCPSCGEEIDWDGKP